MPSLLIRHGRVISPKDGIDGEFDLLIDGGIIRKIEPSLTGAAADVLDARGLVVSPGFVDLHVHLREPGGEESETLETGLRAAVAGGFTAVCPMPNTRPVCDQPASVLQWIEQSQRLALARVFPIAAVSAGSMGETLTDFESLVRAGAVGFSDDGRPVKTAGLMREALNRAKACSVPIIDHCEEPTLSAGGVVNEGPVAERLKVKGIPACAEDVCTARDLLLAAATGGKLHIAHISTARGVDLVRRAKREGVPVTCEVTPHHFTLTEDALADCGTNAKMNPPLRNARDRDAVLDALGDGTIDAIATDHAPHAPALKSQPLAVAPFGVTGLETALALAITRLVVPELISLPRLIELMSCAPASIIRQPLGTLRGKGLADITVFDPNHEWTYRAAEGKSKSRNSPFDGWKLRGKVKATIVGGQVAYRGE